MARIDGLSEVLELLRRQVVDNAKKGDRGAKSSFAGRANAQSQAGRPSIEELQQRVAQRVRAIDPKDERRDQKAARAFLESVLLWQFGEELIQDPRFTELVDDVDRTMAADPGIRANFQKLIKQLTAP